MFRRVQVHQPVGCLYHRILDHAAKAEPGRCRTGARQAGAHYRITERVADRPEGIAAGLWQRHAGRQGRCV